MKMRYRLVVGTKTLLMRSERRASVEYKGQTLKTLFLFSRETELEENLQLRKRHPSCPSHQILEPHFVKNAQTNQESVFHRCWKK